MINSKELSFKLIIYWAMIIETILIIAIYHNIYIIIIIILSESVYLIILN